MEHSSNAHQTRIKRASNAHLKSLFYVLHQRSWMLCFLCMGLVLSQNGILYAQVHTTDIDFDNDSLALNYDYTTWDEVWPEGFDTVAYEDLLYYVPAG